MREIRFRVWDKKEKRMWWNVQDAYDTLGSHHTPDFNADKNPDLSDELYACSFGEVLEDDNFDVMQYTNLKDRAGTEIYELMEVDNKYRVIYLPPKYVLQDISSGDIIDVYDKPTITKEYSPIP